MNHGLSSARDELNQSRLNQDFGSLKTQPEPNQHKTKLGQIKQ